MAEQQLKEAVLAYTILYMAGDQDRESKDSELAGMYEEDLDKCCEDFLLQHFGLKVREGQRLRHFGGREGVRGG